jgi:hypothetical protein
MKRIDRVLFLLALASGCGGVRADPPNEQAPARPTVDGGTVPRQAAVSPNGTPSDCAVPEQGMLPMPTMASFAEAIQGRWLSCNGSVFCSNEIGIEITADGRWYKLYAAGPTTLVRGAGFDETGTWSVIDTSSMNFPDAWWQLNFEIYGSGFIVTHPALSTGPRHMRLNNNGVCQGDYTLDGAP